MYDATVYHCKKEIEAVRFLPEKALEQISSGKATPNTFFKKMLTRFFEMYENEPLFQMYVFVRTEQYFNIDALKIVETENNNIISDIKDILSAFAKAEKIQKKTDKELKDLATAIAGIIIQQRDF